MLQRRFDYLYPNQRTEVFVADDTDNPDWQPAGTWFTPGSNTCVYSRPREEDGETWHELRTCNRRFKESEFLLPRKLADGRSSIRVKVQHVADDRELHPGSAYPEKSAWSEIGYKCYCFVMPR